MSTSSPSSSRRKWFLVKQILEWVSGGLLILSILDQAGVLAGWSLGKGLRGFLGTPLGYGVLVLLFLIWATLRFPIIRLKFLRLAFGPPRLPTDIPMFFRGPRPYRAGERLPGRRADGEACWLYLQHSRFFVLEGESGSGKSSLVNAVLLPKAETVFDVALVRPGNDPYRNTIHVLQQMAGVSTAWPHTPNGLARGIAAIADRKTRKKTPPEDRRPLLICIDQFEEMFRATTDEVRREVHGHSSRGN